MAWLRLKLTGNSEAEPFSHAALCSPLAPHPEMPKRRSKLLQPPRMSPCEKRLARLWQEEDAIGKRLRRDHGTVSRVLEGPLEDPSLGRPPELSEEKIDKI